MKFLNETNLFSQPPPAVHSHLKPMVTFLAREASRHPQLAANKDKIVHEILTKLTTE